jgi:hypothetical protein
LGRDQKKRKNPCETRRLAGSCHTVRLNLISPFRVFDFHVETKAKQYWMTLQALRTS